MKRFIIERKLNPTDSWKPYKRFANENRAKQSLAMLNKHRYSLFNNSNYDQYRLITL